MNAHQTMTVLLHHGFIIYAHLWLIPLAPFVGFLVNGLLGRHLPKWLVTAIALLAPLASFASVLCDLKLLFLPLRRDLRDLARSSRPAHRLLFRPRSTLSRDVARRHRRRFPHPRLLRRLHARQPRLRAVLQLSKPVPLYDHARPRRQCAAHVRRLGGSRPCILSPHWVLVPEAICLPLRARRPSSSIASATSVFSSVSFCCSPTSAR